MIVYTMGFTKKSAEEFFSLITKYEIELLIDVRLNNQSQLAGFTKGRDLPFFLKQICHCSYSHEIQFAPTKWILENYKKNVISWEEYEVKYNELISRRDSAELFKKKYGMYNRVLLLCSETTSEKCHRRLLAEYLQKEIGCQVVHI